MLTLQLISSHIGSSEYLIRNNDTLKDEDNVAWVLSLPEDQQREWIKTLKWVRIPDRLLEHEVFDSSIARNPEDLKNTFTDFLSQYYLIRKTKSFPENSQFNAVFSYLLERWRKDSLSENRLKLWDLYLESLKEFALPSFRISTLNDYKSALYKLSGTLFQTLPYLNERYLDEIGALGTLDQFYNNLRDLKEDTDRGLCYFPDELLHQFNVNRAEIATLISRPDERFTAMIEWLLCTFVTEFKIKMTPLLLATDLHPSWEIMLKNVVSRHERTVACFRACRYNAELFSQTYFQSWVR